MLLKTLIKRYFIGLFSVLILLYVLGQIMPREILNFFTQSFFDNGQIVNEGIHYIVGKFKVVPFFKFLMGAFVLVYSIVFIDIAYSSYLDRKKDRLKTIIEIQERGKKVLEGGQLKPIDEYLEIDNIFYSQRAEKQKFIDEYDKKMTHINHSMAFLAHDLRTPLTSILGYADLLKDIRDLDWERQEKYIDIVRCKAQDLEGLIDQFFFYTKTQLQTEKIVKQDIKLYELLVQVRETFYPYLKEKNLEVDLNIPEDVQISIDPNAMARAFNNLLKNAIFYSEKGGRIGISYESSNSFHSISFTNSVKEGQSLDLDDIFQTFYRGDYSRSQDVKGAGLGLNIAKTIVENHQGQIYANLEGNVIKVRIDLTRG